jgi:hypothetical protein
MSLTTTLCQRCVVSTQIKWVRAIIKEFTAGRDKTFPSPPRWELPFSATEAIDDRTTRTSPKGKIFHYSDCMAKDIPFLTNKFDANITDVANFSNDWVNDLLILFNFVRPWTTRE